MFYMSTTEEGWQSCRILPSQAVALFSREILRSMEDDRFCFVPYLSRSSALLDEQLLSFE